jgi:hypothetical protein
LTIGIDLLMQHVAGITPQDWDSLIIDPVDLGWESFAVKNIRYQNHDMDVEFARKNGMRIKVDGRVRSETAGLK